MASFCWQTELLHPNWHQSRCVSAEMLKSLAGIDMAHVTYRSVPQAVNDVVGGSIDLTFGTLIDSLALIQNGLLKAIGVGSDKRSAALSNVPTFGGNVAGVSVHHLVCLSLSQTSSG